MKKADEYETALVNFERNPLILGFLLAISLGIMFFAWQLLKVVNPMGFLVAVPGCILGFQTLWLMLHPFAMMFTDRVEIAQSFLHRKCRYFVDVKKLTLSKNGKFYITYNDDEVERLNLFGIRSSDQAMFREHFEKFVAESKKARALQN